MRYLDLSERRSPVSRLPSMTSPWTNPSLLICDLLHHAMWPSHVFASFNRCNLTEWAQTIYPAMWTGNSRSWSLASTTTFRYLKVSPLLSRYISRAVWCDQPYLPAAEIWYNLTVQGMNYVSIYLGISITSFTQWCDSVVNWRHCPWSGNRDHLLPNELVN